VERKTFRSELKLGSEEGTFRAVFSMLMVIDKDGDVTLPGAFREGKAVKIAQWGHNWSLPAAGSGVIHSDGEKAWVDGKFNLATAAGREHWETAKFLGADGEWSYGFNVLRSRPGEFGGQQVRFLEEVDVHEGSQVMVGAGIATRTEFVKHGLPADPLRAEMATLRARFFRDYPPEPAMLRAELIELRNRCFSRMVEARYGHGGRR
jgi:hypothetical protein